MVNSLEDFSNVLKEQSSIKDVKVDYYLTRLKESEIIIDEVKSEKLYDIINTINRFSDPWSITSSISYEEIDRRVLELKNAKIKLVEILNSIEF